MFRQNQSSALANAQFVQQSVQELLTNRCIKQVSAVPYTCSPISVVESNSGKMRLVINLRYLNKFLWKQNFKYEDLRVAMLLFEKGDYLFSFDLKSGYQVRLIIRVEYNLWLLSTCSLLSFLLFLLYKVCTLINQ